MAPRPPILGLALALLLAGAAAARPNVVVILADDLGYSDLGSYGGEIETPSLDRLARRGVRFTQFYVTPRCSPTRASLLTGRYSHEVGIGHLNERWGRPGYRGELSRDVPTLAEVLRASGYRTYMAGKWHLAPNPELGAPPSAEARRSWPRERGFDRFFGTIRGSGSFFAPASLVRDDRFVEPGEGFYYTDAISEEAVRFLEEHAAQHAGKPFFLYLAYTAPHWPLHAPEEDVERVAGRYDAGWDALRQGRYRRMVEMGLVRESWGLAPRDPRAPPWGEARHRAWQARRMEAYAAMVERMDAGIGRVLAALETSGTSSGTSLETSGTSSDGTSLETSGTSSDGTSSDETSGTSDGTLIVFLSDNGGNGEELRGIWRLGALTLPIPRVNRWRFGDNPSQPPGPADTFQTCGPGWSSLQNTPFRLGKHATHEGGIATPMIVHWPAGLGVAPGSLVEGPGHVVDLMPTVLEAAGVRYLESFAGRGTEPLSGESLLPQLRGGARRRGPMFFEHEGNRAVREGRWKLVSDWPGEWELYDLEADRTELHDLAAEHPERVARMAALYERFAEEAGVEAWPWVSRLNRRLAQTAVASVLAAALAVVAWRRRRRSRGTGNIGGDGREVDL